MKNTGIMRPVDPLGRVTLPIELRRTLGIEEADPLEIYTDDGSIILRQHKTRCTFCGSEDLLPGTGADIKICWSCARKIAKALEG